MRKLMLFVTIAALSACRPAVVPDQSARSAPAEVPPPATVPADDAAAPAGPAFAGKVWRVQSSSAGDPGSIRERLDIGLGGERDDLESLGRALDEIERRAADRAGRPEDCDAPLHAIPRMTASAARIATGSRPSSRSNTPP